MANFNSTISRYLNNAVIETFYLVRVGEFLTTSYADDIIMSNGERYISNGYLSAVDPPRMSSSVDRQQYVITLADVDTEFGLVSEIGMVGRAAKVLIGFVDQGTGIPDTNIENTITMYKGRADSTGYKAETSEIGSNDYVIKCTSPMGDLDAAKPFYTSRDFIQSINPEDTAFDQLYEGAGKVNLKWGRV